MENRTTGGLLQWAENAETDIPVNPVQGRAYRNLNVSEGEFRRGQQYLTEGKSEEYNQVLWLLSSFLRECEKYGIMRWSDKTDYEQNAFCLGPNGKLYQALQASGPDSGGAQVTVNPAFWRLCNFFESHNELPGRGAADAHPMSAIAGLDTAITVINQDIANEMERAQNAESVLRSDIETIDTAKPDRSELTSVLTGVEWSAGGTFVEASYTAYNAGTKTAGTFTRVLPVATDTQQGVMTKEAYTALGNALQDIDALKQQGGRFIGVSFATKTDLDGYEIPESVNVGDFTYVLDDETQSDATTRYIYDGAEFGFAYVINYDPVGIATSSVLGLVKGDDGPGKVFVEIDGTMSVVGWNSVGGGASARTATITVGLQSSGYTANDVDIFIPISANADCITYLEAAVAAIPNAGGCIVLLNGTYNISHPWNITKDNIIVQGQGPATKINMNGVRDNNGLAQDYTVIYISSANSGIFDLTVTTPSNSAGTSCGIYVFSNGVRLRGIYCENKTTTGACYGIYIGSAPDSIIDECFIKNSSTLDTSIGIYTFSANRTIISKCSITNTSASTDSESICYGIYMGTGEGALIHGCAIGNRSTSSLSTGVCYGIYMFSNLYSKIANNHITNRGYGEGQTIGISGSGGTYYCIHHNMILPRGASESQSTMGVNVSGNDVYIVGNYIYNNAPRKGASINVGSNDRFVITDNQIRPGVVSTATSENYGIVITSTAGTIISNNTFVNGPSAPVPGMIHFALKFKSSSITYTNVVNNNFRTWAAQANVYSGDNGVSVGVLPGSSTTIASMPGTGSVAGFNIV